MLHELADGSTFTDALRSLGSWLPAFDIALLQAGEESGRLDACFRTLANYYDDRARVARQMMADLAYPAFLFHFAIFIIPFPQLFNGGNLRGYLLQTAGVLVPIYCVIALLIYAAQSRHGETWRSVMESILHPIPVLGTARRYLALARLSAALEGLLSAGVTIIEAWEMAGTACGSPALCRVVRSWRPALNAGQTPAEVVAASSAFPELFANQYSTGEISGRLDEILKRLHLFYQEEGTRKLRAVAQWTPRAVYLCIVLLIAIWIVRWWSNYFQQISNAGGF